jgi:hypothetical protein
MTARRFPPPWTVVEENAACFIVKDRAGMSLAYVYFEEEPGRRVAANCSLATRRGGSRPILRNYPASLPEHLKLKKSILNERPFITTFADSCYADSCDLE